MTLRLATYCSACATEAAHTVERVWMRSISDRGGFGDGLRTNVCVRCGSGHAADWLNSSAGAPNDVGAVLPDSPGVERHLFYRRR